LRVRERQTDRRGTGGRGSGSRPGTKKETEEQSTEVGTEEDEKEGTKVQKWGQKKKTKKTKKKKRRSGVVFFFLFFLSFSFRLFKRRGFSFQNISGFVSLVLGRWTGDHPQEDLAKFGYMS
jgi:hypothetical protein